MKYLIIGLGVYGRNLATDLSDIGNEVIGVDNRAEAVDAIKDYISTAYILDTTDENAISVLPLNNIDVAIVAIGDNFGGSIKTTALLKKSGLKRLFVRAIDPIHEAILQGMDIERILTPEKDGAMALVNEMSLGLNVSSFAVDQQHYVLKFKAPKIFIGTFYSEISIKNAYNLRLIAVTRLQEVRNMIGMKEKVNEVVDLDEPGITVEKDDELVFYGAIDDFRNFYKTISEE